MPAKRVTAGRGARLTLAGREAGGQGVEQWNRTKMYRPGQKVRWYDAVWVALPVGEELNIGVEPADDSLLWGRVRYASRRETAAEASSYAFEVELPLAGLVLVCRRPNLFGWLKTKSWPEPITQMVRRILVMGGGAIGNEVDAVDAYIETAALLLRECAMVTPADVEAGLRSVEEVTADDWRPLFVREDERPGPDQLILLPPDADYSAELGDEYCYVHQGDLSHFVNMMTFNTPGVMARFRLGNARRRRVEDDAVETLDSAP